MADDPTSGTTPEPPAPGPGPVSPRPRPRIVDVIKAAATRDGTRPGDQLVFWGIKTLIEATKSLGFPIVVSFLVLWGAYQFGNKWIAAQGESLKAQREDITRSSSAQIAAQDRTTAALREMAAAQSEGNEITRTLMVEIGMRPPPKRKR